MTIYGEEETVEEILKSHGITGLTELETRKHILDWIRGNAMTISHAADCGQREVLQKLVDKLTCLVPSFPKSATWPTGGDAA